MVRIKRAYEKPSPQDGARYLVDRLWPRSVTKAALKLDGWVKEVAPSTPLRRWFAHDPAKWQEFRRKYFQELDRHSDLLAPLAAAVQKGTVTLIYAARDTEHNNAVALKEYLERKK